MSLEEFTMKRVRRQFTVEFKKNAVSLVNFKYLVTSI